MTRQQAVFMQPGVLAEHLAGFTHEFYRLKQFRRIATRFDKTAVSFLGFLCLAAVRIWLPHYVNRA